MTEISLRKALESWTVLKDDITGFDDSKEEAPMHEDMFQASLENYTIDCGWYGDYPDGCLITYLISDARWDTPVLKIESRTFNDAVWTIQTCLSYYEKYKNS
jgi:hypothetical protein